MKSTEENPAAKTVLAFINALNKEDFSAARKCISDDMVFKGVMGSRDSGDAYIKDMEKMKFKYEVKKMLSDSSDVCLFYDITMSGKKILSSGWYHVQDKKIKHFTVLFDPRPILPPEEKK